MKEEQRQQLIFGLLCVMGFLIGLTIGFFAIGYDIQSSCEAAINSYKNYINSYCVNRPTSDQIKLFNLSGVFSFDGT